MIAELAIRFLLIGALAFGGGNAALPLLERLAVSDTGWMSASRFATGVGLAYTTPGPVLILATYIGFMAAGLPGAVVATLAVFAVPVALAAGAAAIARRLEAPAAFRRFGAGAAAGAVGMLGVTLLTLARPLESPTPLLLLGSVGVAIAARRLPPVALLAGAGLAGGLVAAVLGPG